MFIENKKTWFYSKSEATIPSDILNQHYQVADIIEVKSNPSIFS